MKLSSISLNFGSQLYKSTRLTVGSDGDIFLKRFRFVRLLLLASGDNELSVIPSRVVMSYDNDSRRKNNALFFVLVALSCPTSQHPSESVPKCPEGKP